MNKAKELEKFLVGLKGAQAAFPFGPEAKVFKVMGKMFALVSQQEEPARLTLKCKPADGEVLVGRFDSVTPGYYMNKRHWITVKLGGELSDQMIVDLAGASYDLVVDGLSKAQKRELHPTRL